MEIHCEIGFQECRRANEVLTGIVEKRYGPVHKHLEGEDYEVLQRRGISKEVLAFVEKKGMCLCYMRSCSKHLRGSRCCFSTKKLREKETLLFYKFLGRCKRRNRVI